MTTTPSVDVGLWTVLEVYLTQRRALGFRLVEEERHARRFLEWLQAHGHAKGRKHRSTPLSATIGDQLRAYLQERSTRPGTALFPGPHGTPLSRDAIEHRLAAHVHTATTSCPSMAGKHITVHTLRHTTAMNLLHAGVDITVIALWLGHEQTSTTDVYLHADTRLKEDALDKTRPPHVTPGMYTPRADILAWLESL